MAPSHEAGRLAAALVDPRESVRLAAALAAGTQPAPELVAVLVERCADEPDFFVRDMLTWALTRQAVSLTVPALIREVGAGVGQARSQALHTLSKIGDRAAWPAITPDVLHDPDPEVARSAWRAAVVLVPAGDESELARELCGELGRGDRSVQRSLSRALAALGPAAADHLATLAGQGDARVRAHALATRHLIEDPDRDVDAAVAEAARFLALQGAPDQVDADR